VFGFVRRDGYGGSSGCDAGQELSGLAGAFAFFVLLGLLIQLADALGGSLERVWLSRSVSAGFFRSFKISRTYFFMRPWRARGGGAR